MCSLDRDCSVDGALPVAADACESRDEERACRVADCFLTRVRGRSWRLLFLPTSGVAASVVLVGG